MTGIEKARSMALMHLPARNRTEGAEEVCVPIKSDRDIIIARQKGKGIGGQNRLLEH